MNYITRFNLLAPVCDYDAAEAYLTEDDMTRYLKWDLEQHPLGYYEKVSCEPISPDDMEDIEWCLETHNSGVIRLKTNKKLAKEQLLIISEWVKGQCSDGLGEGFEQQDFACYLDGELNDDEEYYIMASFDWDLNDYIFEEE